jgi:serine acetyltransferase
MYAYSSTISEIKIGDYVVIAAHALVKKSLLANNNVINSQSQEFLKKDLIINKAIKYSDI